MALYVPALEAVTFLSMKRHTSFIGCAFHAESDAAILAYPTHIVDVINDVE